ncbi:hypothetical protein N665_0038s0041 [Sinapis alba]|nr:hypothetical protein N665_0038s0041 [Sinapis alba]
MKKDFFFQLYTKERKKGNKTSTSMNKIGKQNIMEAFEERFKKGYPSWQPYKYKYDTNRMKYTKFKKLTHNRIKFGFDNIGRIEMSDDWWTKRSECHGLEKSVWIEIANMDLFEEKFHGVVVTRAEGWSAQHGEASLNFRVGGNDGDEADSVDILAAETQALETETQPQAQTQTQPQTQKQTQAGSSRAKRKCKEKDMVVDASERMLEREHASSVENVLEILNALPGVRECEGSRKGFIAFKTNEAKIKFLELRTKIT